MDEPSVANAFIRIPHFSSNSSSGKTSLKMQKKCKNGFHLFGIYTENLDGDLNTLRGRLVNLEKLISSANLLTLSEFGAHHYPVMIKQKDRFKF